MVVDVLRSAKSGIWRLFADRPDILTRGRYYFVPDDTPHYPGWHHLWSGDWTRNVDWPEDAPALGAATDLPTAWTRGELGTDLPPSVALGGKDCIQSGDKYPPEEVGRRLIAGVDSRCWSSQGMPVPDQIPRLWCVDAGIVPQSDGAAVVRWRDDSVYRLDAVTVSQPTAPTVAVFEGHTWLASAGPWSVRPLSALPFGRDFGFHCVARVLHFFEPAPAAVSLCAFEVPSAPVIITPTQVITWPSLGGQRIMSNPVGYTGTHLWSLRREDGALTVYLDGALIGSFSTDPIAAYRLVYCGGIITFPVAAGFILVSHIKLYDNWVGQTQFDADMVSIKALYGIP